jgi:DMSO/TMAO reductase YedYZ heme-binding membrane subunit
MVKILFDFVQFLYAALPLITCVAVLALLSVLLSKSIKKHAAVYYLVTGLPFALVAIPFIGRICGVETFSVNRIPFLGGILRDYIHAGTFGFPLLIIIMYAGALNIRFKWVKKLMSIRKELSIISGFPIFTHSLIRVSSNFPRSLAYFTRHDEYMETARAANEAGQWISNFSLVLGIVLLILFIPLWVTSFDSVRKRMGGAKWKKLQKWSYVLYALLFIHAAGLQVGGLLNPRGGGHAQTENTQAPDNRIAAENVRNQPEERAPGAQTVQPEGSGRGNQGEVSASPARGGDGRAQTENAQAPDHRIAAENIRNQPEERTPGAQTVQPEGSGRGNQGEVSASPARSGGGRGQSPGFADIKVSQQVKQYIHIVSLILIFGSYLYLRLRKARTDRSKRKSQTAEESV